MPRNVATQAKSAPEMGAVIAFPDRINLTNGEYLPILQQQRTIAIAAGDLRAKIEREVQRLLDEGDPLSAIRVGLNRLHSDGAISSRELTLLSSVSDTVFAAQRGKIDVPTALGRVRPIYDELILDNSSSPVALAICSLVSGSYTSALSDQPAPGTMARAASSNKADLGMVGGAVVGGIIGGAIGGFVGFGIGATVGAIAGAVGGKCLS
jgi:hypothetical protein